jgi:hypothetical protein
MILNDKAKCQVARILINPHSAHSCKNAHKMTHLLNTYKEIQTSKVQRASILDGQVYFHEALKSIKTALIFLFHLFKSRILRKW